MSKKPSREQQQKQKQEARRKEALKTSQELWRLPLHGAWMTDVNEGLCDIVIARRSPSGLHASVFLLDFSARGILDAELRQDCSEEDLNDLICFEETVFTPCSEAQIITAIATAHRYARSFGIEPHSGFRKAARLLPPETLDAPSSQEFPCGEEGVPVWYITEDHPEIPNPFQLGLIEKAGGFVTEPGDESDTEIDPDDRFCEEEDDDLYFDPEIDCEGKRDSHAFHVRCGEHAAWICEEFWRRAYPEEWAKILSDDRKAHAELHVLCLYLTSIIANHQATPGVVLSPAECLSALVLTEKTYKQLPGWKNRPFTEALEILKDFWLKAPDAFPDMNEDAPQAHLTLLNMPDIHARIEGIRVATDARYQALLGD